MPTRRFRGSATVVSLCAAGAIYALATARGPMLLPDSADYLAAAPVRLLGYPLFLKIAGVNIAVLLQPLLFAIALSALGLETLAATSSVALAAAIVIGAMVNPYLAELHASVLSESLSMTTLVLFLAAAMRFVRAPSTQAAVLAGIAAGAGAVVRPTAYALIPVVPVMVLLYRERLPFARTALLAALVPLVALPLAERAAARTIHRGEMTSLTGRVLLAKAGIVKAPPVVTTSADPMRALFERSLDITYAPIRDLIARAPSRGVRDVLTLYYEGCLQWTCVEPLRRSSGLSEPGVNDLSRDVGLARLQRAPLNYAALWATHYRALWTAYPARHPGTAGALNAYLAGNRPLPFERDVFAPIGHYALEVRAYQPARFARIALLLAGIVTGVLALLALGAAAAGRPLPMLLSAAALASLAVHGGLLFTAALGVGASRITVSFLPAITTALLCSGWWVAGQMRRPRPHA